MFRNAKRNDKVWSVIFGAGIIEKILTEKEYCIRVRFDYLPLHRQVKEYTKEGVGIGGLLPELFWNYFVIPEEAYTPPKRKEYQWLYKIVGFDRLHLTHGYFATRAGVEDLLCNDQIIVGKLEEHEE